MADEEKDTQAAFPVVVGLTVLAPGMTLRQWYAGMAMTGLNAADQALKYRDRIASTAVAQADALIKELEK